MLDIEKLISLNLLRDKIIEGIGDYKQVEICRNPNTVLKPDEEYIYETVKVHDNYLHDKDNIGIIDEIVRQTFLDVNNPCQLRNVQRYKGTFKDCYGFYLKYRKIEKRHPFDTIFKQAEKVIVSKLTSNEKYFEDDARANARLLLFEILNGENHVFNRGFNKTFNLDLKNIDDFKKILSDVELAKSFVKYVNAYLKNFKRNDNYNGRCQDYLLTRHRDKNGNENTEMKSFKNISLDKSFDKDDNTTDLHELINDGVYEDNSNSILDSSTIDNIEVEKACEIYKYIFDNIEKMLTTPQLNYFNNCLNGESYIYNSSTKSKYKKSIQSSIMDYFKDNKNITKISGKYKLIRNSLTDDLLFILASMDNVQRLDRLVDFLKKDDYKANFISDMIYGDLDLKFRQPLTTLLLGKEIDKEKYSNGKFIYILNLLQQHLLFLEVLNETDMFMFNKVDVDPIEFEIKQYIESNVFKDKEVGLLPTRGISGYISFRDLHEFMNEKLRYNIPKNKIKKVIKSYGYDVSCKKSCTIKGYSSYKVFRC